MVLMSRTTARIGALLAVAALGLVSACGSAGPGAATSDKLQVVVAFYPFQYAAERVGGDRVEVTSLTAPGAEPHDLELTPRQVAAISEADLVVYQKGFQAAVDEAIEQNPPKHAIDVASIVHLEPVAEGEEHDHEHAEGEHSEGGESGTEEHDHEAGSLDPHQWLLPTNLATTSDAIATQLEQLDPDSASTFQTNRKAVDSDLDSLQQEFSDGLKTCERREFITTHAAFGYLAGEFDLTQIAISGINPDAEPSPARIKQIHTEATEHGVTTIFTETLVSPAVAEAIAGDLGLKTDVLDPLEGITDQSKGTDYLQVQRANLTALKTANGCR